MYANVEHFVKKLYKKTVNPWTLKKMKSKLKKRADKLHHNASDHNDLHADAVSVCLQLQIWGKFNHNHN